MKKAFFHSLIFYTEKGYLSLLLVLREVDLAILGNNFKKIGINKNPIVPPSTDGKFLRLATIIPIILCMSDRKSNSSHLKAVI